MSDSFYLKRFRIWLNRDTWYAHFPIRGKRYRVKLDAQNREQAQKMAADIEYEVLAENFKILCQSKSITMQELSDRYLEYTKTKNHPGKEISCR